MQRPGHFLLIHFLDRDSLDDDRAVDPVDGDDLSLLTAKTASHDANRVAFPDRKGAREMDLRLIVDLRGEVGRCHDAFRVKRRVRRPPSLGPGFRAGHSESSHYHARRRGYSCPPFGVLSSDGALYVRTLDLAFRAHDHSRVLLDLEHHPFS